MVLGSSNLELMLNTQTEKQFVSFRAKREIRKNLADRLADWFTESFGTVLFFGFHIVFFAVWVVMNLGWIPRVPIFDPFPYGLLTMVVSLEAIFLSIIVLISQNRASETADLREELDLQINVRAEEEITRILNILDAIHDHLGLNPEDDEELKTMKQKTDIDAIEGAIEDEIRQSRQRS